MEEITKNGKYRVTNSNKREIVALLAVEPRIPYWMLAAQMGCHENTLAKLMRMPNDEQAARIKEAIAAIRAAQN